MSSDFVRYSPEIETIDPNIDEYMTRIIDFWEKDGPRIADTGRDGARCTWGAREDTGRGEGGSRDPRRRAGAVCPGHLREARVATAR